MSKPNDRTIKAHPETLMMSHGYDPFLSEGAVKPPVFLTSTFAFKTAEDGESFFDALRAKDNADSGLIYSRFNHPNLQIAEDRLAIFEQGEAAAVFSSGMSAIATTMLALMRPGEVVMRSQPLYGGTETLLTNVLAHMGIKTTSFVDGINPSAVLNASDEAMKEGYVSMIFVETPSNPTNTLINFDAIKQAADAIEEKQSRRPIIVCDNTLLGPIFQSPLQHGVDIVAYSLTKYVGGHSDLVAGAAIGSKKLIEQIRSTRSAYGTQLDPHSSWMLGRSLETVSIRMKRAAETGEQIALWLSKQPQVVKVHHPLSIQDENYQKVYDQQCSGPGSTFSFELDGGKEASFAFLNRLTIFKLAVSLGGTESLACHPRSTTHSSVPSTLLDELGVSDSLVRTSIGLEHPDDLIADLDQAMNAK